MRTPPHMLMQAGKLYTPPIFDAFQGEYETSLAAWIKPLDGNNEYLVGDFIFEEEYKVTGDPLKQTVECICQQFDRIGILCGHALKVLDLMNIKLLPPQYVLKRWTREARSGTIQDHRGRNIIKNPNMDAILRCRYMSHKFLNLAQRAANFPECTMLVDNTLDILGKQIEEKINACASTSSYPCTAPTNTSPLNDSLSTAHLKKKEVETRSSKRTRTWLDKKKKFRKKRQNTATPQVWEEADSGGAQAQEQVAHDIVSRDKVKESQGYKDNISFTQMLMEPLTDDVFTRFG
ncbi:hypothetical protein PVAP13_7KG169200 [Panicum virgatum]|uniref:Protein FAR1-RELATED SEQUENCE n=1 Tax=Panicum virgatum TaxID=38727 RepID=A0A8T0QBR5_PANVG|nr:hypothetical protein PVAP13_7KG169200 [Panicum virgatum]